MKNKVIISAVLAGLLIGVYCIMSNKADNKNMSGDMSDHDMVNMKTGVMDNVPTANTIKDLAGNVSEVKEFNMDSWMEMKDGKMGAFFSLKEIKVKKGDKVKININNTKGTHDFVIDEFGVKKDTPEGKVTVIEFTADKTGSFEYYCSKYSHRTMGQTGTLIVE